MTSTASAPEAWSGLPWQLPTHCKTYRWDVKHGADPYAQYVPLYMHVNIAVSELQPFHLPHDPMVRPDWRIPPFETTLWQVTGTVDGIGPPGQDGDLTFALTDATGTIHCECPSLECSKPGTIWYERFVTARAATEALQAALSFSGKPHKVTLNGPGFWDMYHYGPTHDPREIHPVLWLYDHGPA
jgi:hypothetical protein